ncbi:hypothetical protein LEN26_011461 [Aphanomyces euteiches]|nr:hypothetical protein LEN26_011461 [Aphanomyces euteiches]KAH9129032.1 hypothetical protein AeMF1_000905 [Aphanomyces euteiches]KAH9181627.1 hypothetical protein AeNC1_016399 [Aphanomyces euteiches]
MCRGILKSLVLSLVLSIVLADYCDICNDDNVQTTLRSHSPQHAMLLAGFSLKTPSNATTLSFQLDSNVVLLNAAGKPTWDTRTQGKDANRLVMQDDGNLVLLTTLDKPIWASQTSRIGQSPFCFHFSDLQPPTVWDSQCYALFSSKNGVYRPRAASDLKDIA